VTIYNPYRPVILPAQFTYKSIHGWFDYRAFYDHILDKLCAVPQQRVAVEVGSWFGQSTAYFAGELKRQDASNVDFYAVDTWEGTPNEAHHMQVVARYGGSIFEAWKNNMQKCKVTGWVNPLRKPSVEAAKEFADESVDFVFLDADHTTPGVVADIQAWRSKIRPGGTLAGHDADWSEVWAGVEQELPGLAKRFERCWVVENWPGVN